MPVRDRRVRPPRPLARRGFRRRAPRRDRADLARTRRPLLRDPDGRDRDAAEGRDVVHRRMNAPHKPELTDAGRPATFDVEALNERGEALPTPIAGEHPLTLYLDKREIVTLMTLGQAPEALAIGYLRNQRLVGSLAEIAAVQVDWETDSVAVKTRKGVKGLAAKMKKRTVTTGCGQGTVFGDLMEEVESIRLRDDVRLTEETLYALLELVRKHETIYKAADAIAGQMWLADIDGSDKIFYT